MPYFIAFMMLLFATPALNAAPSEHVMPTEPKVWHQQDLKNYIDASNIINITVNEQPLDVLFQTYMNATKRGIAIILPDIGTHCCPQMEASFYNRPSRMMATIRIFCLHQQCYFNL